MKPHRTLSYLILMMAGCLSGSRPLTLHDFHASVTQMQYNAKDKAFEISIRVFTDDLEETLSRNQPAKIHLSGGADRTADKNDPLLEKYVRAHFAWMNPQQQLQPFNYVGHEVEADANWLYLEMPYAEPFRGGKLKQGILMELFDDQVNMVNIQYQGQKKTFVFRKNQPIQDIAL